MFDQAKSQNTAAQQPDDYVVTKAEPSPDYRLQKPTLSSQPKPTPLPLVTHGHNAAYQQNCLTSQQPYISEEEKVDGPRNVRFDNHNATPEHGLRPQNDKGHPALKSYLSSPSSKNDNSNLSDFVR